MTFYEVVGHDPNSPAYEAADSLAQAKQMRERLFATGKYVMVFIRQYMRDRHGNCDRYRVLHRFTLHK
jgi:hypothetical protein